jgi:hypothetical protein
MTRAKKVLWAFAVVFVSLPLVAFGGEIDLSKTGQTTCYDSAGNVIACPGTGQDGDVQAVRKTLEPLVLLICEISLFVCV